MSILPRVINWLRAELNAMLGPDSWPQYPPAVARPARRPRGTPAAALEHRYCVRRRSSVRGARRLARGGVLEPYGEHGEQAQRSNGGLIACFGRQVVRNAG